MEGEASSWGPSVAVAIALIGTIGSILVAKIGEKKGASPSEGQATVLAGSITDGKRLDDLTKALESAKEVIREGSDERHRDARDLVDVLRTVCLRLEENTQAHRAGVSMPYDARLAALIAQLNEK